MLTKRAVEKHINSIFMKLGLAGAEDVSKRVKATLLFLVRGEAREPASAETPARAIAAARLRLASLCQ